MLTVKMNKKGAMWVAYVLAVMFFVALAITVITWSRSRAETVAESMVTIVSGKLDCQEVRIDASVNTPACTQVDKIYNKGSLNIRKVLVRYDGTQTEVENLEVLSSVGPIPLGSFSEVSLLPVIDVGGNLFGCQDKTLVVECP